MQSVSGSLRLTKIRFRSGPTLSGPKLDLTPSTVVVLVGPNNSGKSLCLREVENWCFANDAPRSVVDSVEVDFPKDLGTAIKLLREFETPPPSNQARRPGAFFIALHSFRPGETVRHQEVDGSNLSRIIGEQQLAPLRAYLTAPYTVRLDGRTRFSLVDPKPSGDLQLPPQNHLWALFKDDTARERVRQLTEEAFRLHFVIDPTGMQSFRIRMSRRRPTSKSEEQSLEDVAREFHEQATMISEFSDGVQAFVGLVSAVLSLPHKIILIDEPDAFLHPPLARRLGGTLRGSHVRGMPL